MRVFGPAVALLLTAASHAAAQQAVIVVRHAEKADQTPDTALSPKGRARAKALADLLRDAGVTHIVTSEYRRSQETAAPLAKAPRAHPGAGAGERPGPRWWRGCMRSTPRRSSCRRSLEHNPADADGARLAQHARPARRRLRRRVRAGAASRPARLDGAAEVRAAVVVKASILRVVLIAGVAALPGCAARHPPVTTSPAAPTARAGPGSGLADAAAALGPVRARRVVGRASRRAATGPARDPRRRGLGGGARRDADAGRVTREVIGRSVEGRDLLHLAIGRGPTHVLLWSQMHGDEPSATPAIFDLLESIRRERGEPAAVQRLEVA